MKRSTLSLSSIVVLSSLLFASFGSAAPGSPKDSQAPKNEAPAPAAKPAKPDETLANFKKYFHTYKETPVRVEALLALEGVQDPGVVDTIAPVLKDPDPKVVDATVRVLAQFKERPPIDQMLAILKSEKSEPVRLGILRALGDGKYTDCAPAIAACLTDKSWPVRYNALKAMAVQNDPKLADLVAPMCDDGEMAVRCEALETLARLKSEAVVPKAIVALNGEPWQIRSSALVALTAVRSKDAVEPLINRLSVEKGVLVPVIGEALANLTGKEFEGDLAKWTAWWADNKANFVLPTPEAISYLRTKHVAATGGIHTPYDGEKVGFVGITTTSRSVMFVIDCSGSMEAEVTEKERFSDGNYPSYQRIDIVKTELSNTIDRLEGNVNFNILSFATKVKPWKDKLQPATILNKSAAKDWIKGLQAIGGASKEDLATAGLTGSANLEMGKTATYDALMTALNVKPNAKGQGPKTGDGTTYNDTKDYAVDVDTVFFLSDGRPTVGAFVDPDDILRELKEANDLRKVTIHTIAIGEFQKDFMKKIAEQNHGQFVDLGK